MSIRKVLTFTILLMYFLAYSEASRPNHKLSHQHRRHFKQNGHKFSSHKAIRTLEKEQESIPYLSLNNWTDRSKPSESLDKSQNFYPKEKHERNKAVKGRPKITDKAKLNCSSKECAISTRTVPVFRKRPRLSPKGIIHNGNHKDSHVQAGHLQSKRNHRFVGTARAERQGFHDGGQRSTLNKAILETKSNSHSGKSNHNDSLIDATIKVNTNGRFASECTKDNLEKLILKLMRHQCALMGIKTCGNSSEWRHAVVGNMFNEFDFNSDFHLESLELNTVEQIVIDVSRHSRGCRLSDLLAFYDTDRDNLLSRDEIFSAFGISVNGIRVSNTIVTVGTSLELTCEIQANGAMLWERNGKPIKDVCNDEVKVLDNGSLYIRSISLSHIGNYSCVNRDNQNMKHHHVVSVQMSPIVRVSPLTQFHLSGRTVTLHCHAEGVPKPYLSWAFNETPVPDQPEHYLMLNNGHTLKIMDARYLHDTGAFKCKAQNVAGTSQDIATVFIENSAVPKYGQIEEPHELFIIFNENGYSINEPSHCRIQHIVTGSFDNFKYKPVYMNDLIPSLCKPNDSCSWGGAVNVRNKFVYVTQPDMHRVVVLEIRELFNPVEIIPTDRAPVQINYVEHLDEIWVLCWNEGMKRSTIKTSLIIRQASFDIQHHTIHVQPFESNLTQFSSLFIPPNNALNQHFTCGYAVIGADNSTYKVDLVSMKVTKKVILDCVPLSMVFISLGGKVVVNCDRRKAEGGPTVLILDHFTDEILVTLELHGDPYISPDSRFFILVDNFKRIIAVYHVTDEGVLDHQFSINTNMHISDVTFLSAEGSYDLFASSSNKGSILYINLPTGQVETIEGVGGSPVNREPKWSSAGRVIVSGGMFSDYLMIPSAESIAVIDGRRRHLHCEWQNDWSLVNVIVWAEVSRL